MSDTSTWPVPLSTSRSWAATSGITCISEASNFSCTICAESKRKQGKTVKVNKMRLLSTFLVNIKITHTHFPSRVDFAQPLCLLLHCPPLKQLLEKCRLGSVVNRLHVCCDRVVFGFNKLLQSPPHPKKKVTLLEDSLSNHFQLNTSFSR